MTDLLIETAGLTDRLRSALPTDAAALRTASRCRELRDRLPAVDLTLLYANSTAGALAESDTATS